MRFLLSDPSLPEYRPDARRPVDALRIYFSALIFIENPTPGWPGRGRVAENSHKLRSYVSFRTAAISARRAPIYYSPLKIRAASTGRKEGKALLFFSRLRKTSFVTINIYEHCKMSSKREEASGSNFRENYFRVCPQEITVYAD